MNWHERISMARKRGEFTTSDRRLSGDWVTCACGEQDPRIPRWPEAGEPRDLRLRDLGLNFSILVCQNDFDKAETMLLHIEKRSGEILAEVTQ